MNFSKSLSYDVFMTKLFTKILIKFSNYPLFTFLQNSTFVVPDSANAALGIVTRRTRL